MNLLSTVKAITKEKYSVFKNALPVIRKSPYLVKSIFVLLISVILSFIISPTTTMNSIKHYHVGDIARQTIYAPQDIEAVDVIGTEKNTERILSQQPPIFRYNPFIKPRMYNALVLVFSIGRTMYQEHKPVTEITEMLNKQTGHLLGKPISQDTIMFLYKRGFSKVYEDKLLNIIQRFYDRYKIVDNVASIQDVQSTGLVLITPGVGKLYIRDVNSFIDPEDAKNILFNFVSETFPFLSIEDHIMLTNFIKNFVVSDVNFDNEATENNLARLKSSIKPYIMHLKKGEVIVREGERIDRNIYAKLVVVMNSALAKHWYVFVLFYSIIFFVLIFSVLEFSQKNIRKFSINFKDGVFLSIVLILTVVIAKLSTMLTSISEIASFNIPQEAYYYAAPIAFGGMLVRLILNSEIAVGFSIVAGLSSAMAVSNNLFIVLYYIISGILGAHTLAKCEQRTSIIKGGLIVSGVNVLLVSMFLLIQGNQPASQFMVNIIMAFFSGVTSAVLVIGLTPVFEYLFDYATDIKLLELANLENPLLKELFVTAPGSYNHSMMTATLAEAAASSIHANPLLARVASYYHDIGKIKMPDYFIENQQYMPNKHDKLSPSMSSLIIISHVKEGKELAKANKLPKKIVDIIMQHHGTSLVKYFYEKAKEKNGNNIREEEYHYPGPKPQTREAGIVMLADAVEAASRTLTDPTPAKIKAMVEKIVNTRFEEGQLDECTLSLSDLNAIKKSFVKVLSAIFHKRVDYPGFKFDTARIEKNGYSNILPIQKK
ncbi:MAG: HD family phosphohydrolase [bacterium]